MIIILINHLLFGPLLKLNKILLAILCTAIFNQPVIADDLSELKAQLKAMQQQMLAMQAKINAQDIALQEQDKISREIKHQQALGNTGEKISAAGQIGNSMTMGGVIEIKALNSSSKDWSEESESDIVLDKFELGIDATASNWASGHMLFLYEQDPGPGRDADNLQVDEAYITLANSEVTPFYATFGRIYVPFGSFESNMISDPITLTLAETRNEVIQLGFETDSGFYGSGFVFNGDIPEAEKGFTERKNTHIADYGINIGYTFEKDNFDLDVGAGYMNNLAASGGIYGAMDGNAACAGDDCVKDHVGGMSLYAIANIGDFNLIGEYVAATEDFASTDFVNAAAKGQKLRPKAWNIEGAYHFTMVGKKAVFSLGYQKSDDFYLDESTDYFEKAWLASFTIDVAERTTLIAEWRHANGYKETKAVVGNEYSNDDLMKIKLSYEF